MASCQELADGGARAPQKARPDAVRKTPQQSADRRAGGRIPPVISGDAEIGSTARRATGCGVPHQRLPALCSPHFSGNGNRRRAPAPSPNGAMALGCLTSEDGDGEREGAQSSCRPATSFSHRAPEEADQLTYHCSARCAEAPGIAADARPER
jgi:hypothetical protein